MQSLKTIVALCCLLVANVASFGTVCPSAFGARSSTTLSMSAVAEASADAPAGTNPAQNLRCVLTW